MPDLSDICVAGFAHKQALVISVGNTVGYKEISALPLTSLRADGIGRFPPNTVHCVYTAPYSVYTVYTQSIHCVYTVYTVLYSVRVECSSIWSSDKP